MKTFKILVLLNFWSIGLNAQNVNFKHHWDVKYLEHGILFTSKNKAPIPFSKVGEPQATMNLESFKLDKSTKNDLGKIVANEINGIRKELSIIEYSEDDYKAKDDIVLYSDKVANVKIMVIKYRTNGVREAEKTIPRSARQILFIHNNKLWISSLIVLFAKDQDNMRSDQMSVIKAIIKKK